MAKTEKKKKSAFVILPLSVPKELYDDSKHFHHVFEYLFKPSLEASGFEPIFPETQGSEIIHEEIIKNLEISDLVLCDMSLLNPNVFFELGIRTALNKPVCMVTDERTNKIPFDTNIISYHTYNSKLEPWNLESEKEQLTKHIKLTIKKRPNVNALWNVFGFKISGTPTDMETATESSKFLELENELLKTKIEQITNKKKLPSSVIPESGQYHKCSNCGYGFRIDGYLPGGSIRIGTGASIEIGGTYYGGGIYGHGVTCPNCGNVDSI